MARPDTNASLASAQSSSVLAASLETAPPSSIGRHWIALIPPLTAAAYPFLLMLFHAMIGAPDSQRSGSDTAIAAIALLLAFAAPVAGIVVAQLPGIPTRARRVAYLSVASPSLYVFLGVVQALVGSTIPDPWVWCVLWTLAAASTFAKPHAIEAAAGTRPSVMRWRVAHGISAAVVLAYVLFHLGNHLAGWLGPDVHATVMDAGRNVYRAKLLEPLLVVAFLFQAVSGLYLAWQWSHARQDAFRTFQIASGVFLSIFIVGHMNSVFVYARTYLGIPTDWAFATGAPAGLIHDAWNIRLVPHYALGVFFVLGHLFAGLKVVLKAHGVSPQAGNRVMRIGLVFSAALAAAIIAAMCGARI
ncbi:hypothetical protein [Achromobacter spanius]|uniref:hypothetical protein n=1 Tax=Achromobacter spanius TaxID=217203 RepID=UPI001F36D54C|nr:hypothetical protein [Achromobacter spanius]